MPTSETRWTGPPEETPLPALQLAGVAELDIWWRRVVFALAKAMPMESAAAILDHARSPRSVKSRVRMRESTSSDSTCG